MAVAQRSEGGVVILGGAEVHQGTVEVEVGHAVQAWLLSPSSNLGLEVQGEVAVEEVRLIMDTQVVPLPSASTFPLIFSSCPSPPHQEVEGTWRPRSKRSAPPSCTKRCLRSQQMSVLNVQLYPPTQGLLWQTPAHAGAAAETGRLRLHLRGGNNI